jgi:hypothetical protein
MMTRIFYLSIFTMFVMNTFAQEVVVPVELQSKLIMKSLKYIKNLDVENRTVLTIGVLYQERNKISLDTKDELLANLRNSDLAAEVPAKVEIKLINANAVSNITEEVGKVNLVYVAPLRAFDVEGLAITCQEQKIMTISAVPEYLAKGLVMSFGLENSNPKIEINLASAKQSNITISGNFLQISKIVAQ